MTIRRRSKDEDIALSVGSCPHKLSRGTLILATHWSTLHRTLTLTLTLSP